MGRLFDLCLGALIAALMVYAAVQLVRSVLWWLVGIAVAALAIGVLAWLVRAHRERW